jgi:hypothetical protein
MRKDIKFPCETEKKKALTILKKALCNAPGLKTLAISDGAGQIDMGVDNILDWCGVILRQEDENNERHPC